MSAQSSRTRPRSPGRVALPSSTPRRPPPYAIIDSDMKSSRKDRNAREEFIGLRRIPGEGRGGVEEMVNHGLSRTGFANARLFWGCANVSSARPCRSVVELATKNSLRLRLSASSALKNNPALLPPNLRVSLSQRAPYFSAKALPHVLSKKSAIVLSSIRQTIEQP